MVALYSFLLVVSIALIVVSGLLAVVTVHVPIAADPQEPAFDDEPGWQAIIEIDFTQSHQRPNGCGPFLPVS